MIEIEQATLRAPRRQQRGAAAIAFVLMLLVMLGFMGMALDLAQLYNRKAELAQLASTAAMAAAPELNGTAAGVANALTQAGTSAIATKYQYGLQAVTWSDAAIKFSASATASDAEWLSGAAAQAAPNGLLFVKVDTSALDDAIGTVPTSFMRILSPSLTSTTTAGLAIAGRSTINITPLAVCAMSATPAASRSNGGSVELVEYGFRRGVGYDLMQLNPNGADPVNFVIDPIDPPGTPGLGANVDPTVVGTFVCSGSMLMPRVMGAPITVQQPFPLAALFNQLNSRFDLYVDALCSPNGAPPDFNVRRYVYGDNAAIPWMTTSRNGQAAGAIFYGGKLWTKADPLPAQAVTAGDYGPLWSYAKAVPFSAYAAGVAEPAGGYATFATSAWASLYSPGLPAAGASYPATTPYRATAGANFLPPSTIHLPGLRNRRVLNIPLLSCPVAAGAAVPATVLAIGKFFMTVPATATSVYAEFAGVVPEQSLGGPVERYK